MILAYNSMEGLDIEALYDFDEKAVKTFCVTVRKPGHIIAGFDQDRYGLAPQTQKIGI